MDKKNMYYLKDKKAQIYHKVPTTAGIFESQYQAIAASALWCYTAQLSQSDIYEAKNNGESETRYFVFNHLTGIALYDLVLYRNTWYRITRIDTKDDYNTDTFVYVQLAIDGWIPKDSELLPYQTT